MKNLPLYVAAALAASLVPVSPSYAQTGLEVDFGSKGVSRIIWNGAPLADTGTYPGDQFHIWHMKSTDLAGNAISSGQYGWGESNNSTTWDPASRTETYTFTWGNIQTRFVQAGNTLNVIVTETNNPASGILFDGAELYPFTLHFPTMPTGFNGYTQYSITTTGPGVSAADFATGRVTSVIPDESLALYGGWKSAGGSAFSPLMTTTSPDGLASFLPHHDVPLAPGQSLSYTVSFRFTASGIAADTTDAYSSFAHTYPSQMHWADRRLLGTAYLASSPSGNNITAPGGFPTNPRRYFNDPSVDITTDTGRRAFQARILAQAASNVANAAGLNSQGIITWDIEGEQYPQSTSYVCSPDQIATVAPEMELPVLDQTSRYAGLPLSTAYFRTMADAGLRTGVCLRPQQFTLGSNGSAQQVFLTGNAAIVSNLETKARYSNTRWGTTIFYVDSTVDQTGGTLDPAIFGQLITDLPNFLFIPEESTPRYYAYTAPFFSFLFHTDLGTPAEILKIYPNAFGANLVNDVSPTTLAAYTPQLTAQVRQGDILMGHADYWQANNPALVSIYIAAGVSTPTPAPVVPAAPVISWATPASITAGTAIGSAQLDASANVAGTFTYTPAAGTVPSVGAITLQATFLPADTTRYTSATASTTLTVTPVPVVTPTPAPAPTPAPTPTPTPTANVNLAILLPLPGATISGIISVTGYVNLPLDSAGTFLMVDGQEVGTHRQMDRPFLYPLDTSTLSNGTHTLQLWAHDIGNNTTLSAPIPIVVKN